MEDFERAKKTAFKFIGKRLRTEKEIRQKLMQHFDAELTDSIIGHLQALELIDDSKYVGCYIRDRLKLNPMGKRRIKLELEMRGIPAWVIEENSDYCNLNEVDIITGIIDRKKKQYDIQQPKDRQRLTDFFYRRGFDAENIHSAIQRYCTPPR